MAEEQQQQPTETPAPAQPTAQAPPAAAPAAEAPQAPQADRPPQRRGGGRDGGGQRHGGGGGGGRGGQRGGGRGRGDRDRGGETEEGGVESSVVRIYRCAKVVKGGRTFSFGALVVAGDRRGNIGIGYGKANEVPPSVEKATKDARKAMFKVNLKGTTIPHQVQGTSGASK